MEQTHPESYLKVLQTIRDSYFSETDQFKSDTLIAAENAAQGAKMLQRAKEEVDRLQKTPSSYFMANPKTKADYLKVAINHAEQLIEECNENVDASFLLNARKEGDAQMSIQQALNMKRGLFRPRSRFAVEALNLEKKSRPLDSSKIA